MILLICLLILISQQIFPQGDVFRNLDIHSPPNIKKFADYLFCTKDYHRAVNEYENYLNFIYSDTVQLKIGLAYSSIGNYNQAMTWFKKIRKNSMYFYSAEQEYYKSLFQLSDFLRYRKIYKEDEDAKSIGIEKLFYFSFFFTNNKLPTEKIFFKPFSDEEKKAVEDFYQRKIDPPRKSVSTAVILSALIPGSGKIYADQLGDGIITAISTGLLAFLAYDNFKADHDFRGYLFSGLTLLFYSGNIYGSAAAAQIYNAGLKFNFEKDLKLYLNNQNYFVPRYEFCK